MPWFPKRAYDFDDWFKDPLTNKVVLHTQVTTFCNISYAEDDICKLDIYMPEGYENKKVPTIINIHGGGWITGDKYKRRGQGYIYADNGICMININYGLSPEYRYHEAVKHCFLAMKWAYDNADKYHFDMDNFFITGDSAGAQLACLMLATQNKPEFKKELNIPECPARFKSGILSCGPYDADATVDNRLSSIFITDMTGEKRTEVKEYKYWEAFRTLDWVDEDFPEDVLITYGRWDFIVGDQHKSLLKKLDELGKRHYDYRAKGLGDHCYHLYYKRKNSQIFYKVVGEYFKQMLDPKRDSLEDKTLKLSIPIDEEYEAKERKKECKAELRAAKKRLKELDKERKELQESIKSTTKEVEEIEAHEAEEDNK